MSQDTPTPSLLDTAPELVGSLAKFILHGGSMGMLLDVSEREYQALYALGHSLYASDRYDDAAKLFGMLVRLDPLERRYANAFAATLQMMGRYEDALTWHSMSSVMDIDDPVPTFHSAECLMALGRTGDALDALEMVIAQGTAPRHQALRARAQALRELVARNKPSQREKTS